MLNMMIKVLNEQNFIKSHGYIRSKAANDIIPKYVIGLNSTLTTQQYLDKQIDIYNRIYNDPNDDIKVHIPDVEYIHHECKYLKDHSVNCLINVKIKPVYISNGSKPVESIEINHYQFIFSKNSEDKWYVHAQVVSMGKQHTDPEGMIPIPEDLPTLTYDDTNVRSSITDDQVDLILEKFKEQVMQLEGKKFRQRSSQYFSKQKYNPVAAVKYAKKYALKPNRKYYPYPSDCTNFASQVLRAGGWKNTNFFYGRKTPYAWWHVHYYYESISWINAHKFYVHLVLNNNLNTKFVRRRCDIQLGDIVSVAWGYRGASEASIKEHGRVIMDHSMIVTKKDDEGDGQCKIYLTYHSNDRKDVLMKTLMKDESGSHFYAFSILP